MRAPRRWLAALLVALGLVPGAERLLLAHAHHPAGPFAELSAAHDAGPSGALSGCAACQARATLEALAFDPHPERHGVAPAAPPEVRACAEPHARLPETPPARGPPLRIV